MNRSHVNQHLTCKICSRKASHLALFLSDRTLVAMGPRVSHSGAVCNACLNRRERKPVNKSWMERIRNNLSDRLARRNARNTRGLHRYRHQGSRQAA